MAIHVLHLLSILQEQCVSLLLLVQSHDNALRTALFFTCTGLLPCCQVAQNLLYISNMIENDEAGNLGRLFWYNVEYVQHHYYKVTYLL
jgi:hypothetical protein